MAITYRNSIPTGAAGILKSSALTAAEIDANFASLQVSPTLLGTPTLPTNVIPVTASQYPTVQPTLNLDFANSKSVDPRITFVRNSTATYYDGQTTAMAEQNLLLQSNTFSNAAWVATNGTVVSGITDPAGTTTAFSFTATGVATLYQTLTTKATPYTLSFYIQRVTGTGAVNLTLDGTTLTPQAITGSWARYSVTATPTAVSHTIGLQLAVITDSVNIFIAQLENRSSMTAANITTTAAITNYIPQLMTAPAGVPRLGYNPTTGVALGLLIEESRTNLLTYSVGNGESWSIRSGTFVTTANAQVAPDGTITATQLTKTATIDSMYQQAFTAVVGVTYTASVYFEKTSSVNVIEFAMRLVFSGGDLSGYLSFDTATGTYAVRTGVLTNINIVDCGRYWRVYMTSTGTTSGTRTDSSLIIRSTTGVIVGGFTATALGSCIFWGAQLEAGAFATSYIPTVATTITRAADQDTQATQVNVYTGSIKLEFIPNHGVSSLGCPLWSSYIDASNYSAIFHDGTNMLFRKRIAGTNYDASIALTYVAAQLIKVAVSWSNVNINIAVNGLLGTANANTLPLQLSSIQRIGALEFLKQANNVDEVRVDGGVKNIAYYPIVLSTSNLVALTS